MNSVKSFLKCLRPYQWSKNILVFAGLVFSHEPVTLEMFLLCLATFFMFNVTSGFIYVINDIADREIDKFHPEKRHRPIASGQISIPAALTGSSVLLAGALLAAFFLVQGYGLLILLLVYLLLNALYSYKLKHVVILDLLLVASGFVLRAIGGVVVLENEPTLWFLICIFLLALLLATAKRRHEFFLEIENSKKRKVIDDYTPQLLDQIIAISASSALITYSLYTIGIESEAQYMYTTIPLVIYGIFRYLYLIYKQGKGGSPDKLLFQDKHILLTVFLYGCQVIYIFQFIHN